MRPNRAEQSHVFHNPKKSKTPFDDTFAVISMSKYFAKFSCYWTSLCTGHVKAVPDVMFHENNES